MTVERTYKLPGGGQIRVRVTADLVDEKLFPILREEVALGSAEALVDIANEVKA